MELRAFRFLEGKAQSNRYLRVFLIGMVIFSPSMIDSLLYEPNGGLVMLGFSVFLRFLTVCKCGVMALCDDCKMLEIGSKGMGVINLRVGCLLGQCSFMMGLYGIISDSGVIRLWV